MGSDRIGIITGNESLRKRKKMSKMDNGGYYVRSKTSNKPTTLKNLASSMRKTSGFRSSNLSRVTFYEKASEEDDLHTDPTFESSRE